MFPLTPSTGGPGPLLALARVPWLGVCDLTVVLVSFGGTFGATLGASSSGPAKMSTSAHAAPKLVAFLGPPARAVMPSADSATEVPNRT